MYSARSLSPFLIIDRADSSSSFATLRCTAAGGTFAAPTSLALRTAASDRANRSAGTGDDAHAPSSMVAAMVVHAMVFIFGSFRERGLRATAVNQALGVPRVLIE